MYKASAFFPWPNFQNNGKTGKSNTQKVATNIYDSTMPFGQIDFHPQNVLLIEIHDTQSKNCCNKINWKKRNRNRK